MDNMLVDEHVHGNKVQEGHGNNGKKTQSFRAAVESSSQWFGQKIVITSTEWYDDDPIIQEGGILVQFNRTLC